MPKFRHFKTLLEIYDELQISTVGVVFACGILGERCDSAMGSCRGVA